MATPRIVLEVDLKRGQIMLAVTDMPTPIEVYAIDLGAEHRQLVKVETWPLGSMTSAEVELLLSGGSPGRPRE